jgi:hypothetical protein
MNCLTWFDHDRLLTGPYSPATRRPHCGQNRAAGLSRWPHIRHTGLRLPLIAVVSPTTTRTKNTVTGISSTKKGISNSDMAQRSFHMPLLSIESARSAIIHLDNLYLREERSHREDAKDAKKYRDGET